MKFIGTGMKMGNGPLVMKVRLSETSTEELAGLKKNGSEVEVDLQADLAIITR